MSMSFLRKLGAIAQDSNRAAEFSDGSNHSHESGNSSVNDLIATDGVSQADQGLVFMNLDEFFAFDSQPLSFLSGNPVGDLDGYDLKNPTEPVGSPSNYTIHNAAHEDRYGIANDMTAIEKMWFEDLRSGLNGHDEPLLFVSNSEPISDAMATPKTILSGEYSESETLIQADDLPSTLGNFHPKQDIPSDSSDVFHFRMAGQLDNIAAHDDSLGFPNAAHSVQDIGQTERSLDDVDHGVSSGDFDFLLDIPDSFDFGSN